MKNRNKSVVTVVDTVEQIPKLPLCEPKNARKTSVPLIMAWSVPKSSILRESVSIRTLMTAPALRLTWSRLCLFCQGNRNRSLLTLFLVRKKTMNFWMQRRWRLCWNTLPTIRNRPRNLERVLSIKKTCPMIKTRILFYAPTINNWFIQVKWRLQTRMDLSLHCETMNAGIVPGAH